MGGSAAADFIGGLNFGDSSLGLGHHDALGSGLGHEPSGLHGVGLDNSGFGSDQSSGATGGSQMSAMDITSRLESLCLSMTEAALGLSCTNY